MRRLDPCLLMARAILAQNTQDARKGRFCVKPARSAQEVKQNMRPAMQAFWDAQRTQERYG